MFSCYRTLLRNVTRPLIVFVPLCIMILRKVSLSKAHATQLDVCGVEIQENKFKDRKKKIGGGGGSPTRWRPCLTPPGGGCPAHALAWPLQLIIFRR